MDLQSQIIDEARRMETIIHCRKTNWANPPPELISAITKAKQRISNWKKEEFEDVQKNDTMQITLANDINYSWKLFSDLFGELRAAESRKRLTILKHDINNLRETRHKYIINLQPNAVDAIRVKKLLQEPPDKDEKRISRLFQKSEKQRIEEILHYNFEVMFGRQNW